MKIKIRYVILFIVLSLGIVKCIEMYNYQYPDFTMKYVGEYPRFCHAIYDLNYDLFFVNVSEDERVKSKTCNLFRQQDIWEEKEFIGQRLNFSKSSPSYNLDFELFIAEYTLPSYITRFSPQKGKQIEVNGVNVFLADFPQDIKLGLNEVRYKFEFELNGFYLLGWFSCESKEGNLISSDAQREEYITELLKQIFFPKLEHAFEFRSTINSIHKKRAVTS